MPIYNGHGGHGLRMGQNKDSCVSELGCKILQMWSGLDQYFKFNIFVFQVRKPFGRVLPRSFVKYFVDFILAVFIC